MKLHSCSHICKPPTIHQSRVDPASEAHPRGTITTLGGKITAQQSQIGSLVISRALRKKRKTQTFDPKNKNKKTKNWFAGHRPASFGVSATSSLSFSSLVPFSPPKFLTFPSAKRRRFYNGGDFESCRL